MKRMALWMVATAAAAILASGCQKADDEFAPAFVPKTYTFEGKVDPRYAGTWASSDGASSMELVKDGSLKLETTTRSISGKSVSHVSGKWVGTADSLMFQYVVGSQPPTVLKYEASLSGNTLTLHQEGAKAKMAYRKK